MTNFACVSPDFYAIKILGISRISLPNPQSPVPSPQSPVPSPQSPVPSPYPPITSG
ncbi:hypothetical protein FDUTEX481_09864 [Tolypothrix sp. PCC 7601]|nr:hypothetical protein FDUTEX481_09864 [Tolypothrix sp. PCC 7601]